MSRPLLLFSCRYRGQRVIVAGGVVFDLEG